MVDENQELVTLFVLYCPKKTLAFARQAYKFVINIAQLAL